jgi:hypothetical protein
MRPHLSPHKLILKINREPLAELPEELVRADREFWTRYLDPMIGDWLDEDTTVREVADFVGKTFVQRDLSGFKGDRLFVCI